MSAEKPGAADRRELPAELAGWAEFLRAWVLVDRYGVAEWLALEDRRPGDLHPDFADTLLALDSELQRLEFEDDLERARRDRDRHEAQSRMRGR